MTKTMLAVLLLIIFFFLKKKELEGGVSKLCLILVKLNKASTIYPKIFGIGYIVLFLCLSESR